MNPYVVPIPHARVTLRTPLHLPNSTVVTPQTDFQRDTDANGQVEWDHAPDQVLQFDVSAPGYFRVHQVSVPPDGQVHTITLHFGLSIAGAVHDAVKSQLISHFRMNCGWPFERAHGSMGVDWSLFDRFRFHFTGGTFRHEFDEPVVGGVKEPTCIFKFEATG